MSLLTRSLHQFSRPLIRHSNGPTPLSLSTSGRTLANVTTGKFMHIVGPTSSRTANSLRSDAGSQQRSSISTTSPRRVIGWIQDKLTERAQTKKAAKLVDQISLMANSPTWTIKMFADEIDETLSSWQTKIPGASGTAELRAAKDTQQVVKGILDHLGDGVTPEDISRLDRKQKLKLVIACKKPMDEVDRVLQSFKQMSIMHRILRYRKENGIALPSDEEGLKMAMQSDGMKVMTKEEKEEMKEAYGKYALAKAAGKAAGKAARRA
ncbi:hypothetical protein ACHAW5_002591 [Stephanodiscus triporus]|uniref:Signal recognition particle SRP54 subunit M-domain domain-containing protein n=1 Tax=Stephanodiscus triporus TaxID=2934178 RepID=A0ABD3MDR3_9STRA